MIKASELRIGNLVHSNGCEVEITALYDQEIQTTANFDGSCNGYITPIPLTEEWLVRFGIEKEADCFKFLTCFNFLTKTGAIIEHEWKGDGFDVFHCDVKLFFLQHVHQLQNLYFALTGEELTLKQ